MSQLPLVILLARVGIVAPKAVGLPQLSVSPRAPGAAGGELWGTGIEGAALVGGALGVRLGPDGCPGEGGGSGVIDPAFAPKYMVMGALGLL